MKLSTAQMNILLNKPTVMPVVPTIEPKEVCKDYLHDFLAWMHLQNERFSETIQDEELTNFFLNEIQHPIWMRVYLKRNKFNKIVSISSYLMKHKKGAFINQQKMKITPRLQGCYSPQEYENKGARKASQLQINSIKELCKKNRIKLDPFELENITENEANYDLFFLQNLERGI